MKEESAVDILDMNYPLLVKFKEACPGTFSHSKMIAEILEKIGNALELNTRRLKTIGYYHDIGKMVTPILYSENQPNDYNPHDHLEAWVSFALVTAHVAHTANILLNDPNIDNDLATICSQHHGTTLSVSFFKKSGQENEQAFRYTTTRPQSFEAALLMICDHLEARIRSEINSGRITNKEGIDDLVETVFNNLVNDNQFDDVAIPSFKALRNLKAILKVEFSELFKDYKRIDYIQETSN